MRELWRRLLFLFCVCGAVLLGLAAALSPVVLVTPVDFGREQQREGSYMGVRIPTEESKRQQSLSREAYIVEKTKGRLVAGNDAQWAELFDAVAALAQGKTLAEPWKRRLPSDQHPGKVLFFRPEEAPVNALASYFARKHDAVHVVRAAGDKQQYLKAEYRYYSDEDFQLGSGFNNYPTPPTSLLYPYRRYSLWLILFGLAVYAFLPLRRSPLADGARRHRGSSDERALLCFPVFDHGGHGAGVHAGLAPVLLLLAGLVPGVVVVVHLRLVC